LTCMGVSLIHTHLDELDEPVDVIISQVEWRDADGEVDVGRFVDVVVEHFEHVVRCLAAL